MNKIKLNAVFKEIKKKANMDYAVTSADKYGDCNSCVNYGLGEAFGFESKGIWAKHWLKGMNKGCPWKELDDVYIGHDITDGQAKIMVNVLEENGYIVEPREYDTTVSFRIREVIK